MDHPTKPRHRLFDGLQKPPAVRVVAVDCLALVPAGRDMIDGTGIFHSDKPCHDAGKGSTTPDGVKRHESTPSPRPAPVSKTVGSHSRKRLQDYFTKYLHRLRIQLPSSDRPPLPFLDIGRAGTISVDVRFAPILSDEGYPDEIAEDFFAEVAKIAPGMLPRRRKDGTFILVRKKGLSPQERESHAANLRRVISKREDLRNEIRRFLNALLAAADSEE